MDIGQDILASPELCRKNAECYERAVAWYQSQPSLHCYATPAKAKARRWRKLELLAKEAADGH